MTLIENKLGWRTDAGILTGSAQWIINKGGKCTKMQAQRSLGFFNKHHIRVFAYAVANDGSQQRAADGNLYNYTDPHRDRKHFCGSIDAVPKLIDGRSGFDQGSLEVYRGQQTSGAAPYYTWVKKIRTWRNRTFKQCTGEWVGGDGYQNIYRVTGQAG